MKQKGFTIVEIIITVTVIGILAAIVIVSYNGITQRANNAQTVEAVRQWSEALQAYEADHPNDWVDLFDINNDANQHLSCLGEGYPYGIDGTGSSGAQCIGSSEDLQVQESSSAFMSAMQPYFDSGIPTPSFQTSQTSLEEGGSIWVRGAFITLVVNSGPPDEISVAEIGFLQKGIQECPKIGNVTSIPDEELVRLNDNKDIMCVVRFWEKTT